VLHQTLLAANLGPSSLPLLQQGALVGGYLRHQLGPVAARPGSLALVYQLMVQQAVLKAYVDVFRWTALLAFFCACAVWLFDKPNKPGTPPPGIH
jgi:DHA2 family multidrug resistance protein